MQEEINPFDLLSGKIVQNRYGTFWFKEAGYNIDRHGYPIIKNLYKKDGAIIITTAGIRVYRLNDLSFMYKYPDGGSGSFIQPLLNIRLDHWTIQHTMGILT